MRSGGGRDGKHGLTAAGAGARKKGCWSSITRCFSKEKARETTRNLPPTFQGSTPDTAGAVADGAQARQGEMDGAAEKMKQEHRQMAEEYKRIAEDERRKMADTQAKTPRGETNDGSKAGIEQAKAYAIGKGPRALEPPVFMAEGLDPSLIDLSSITVAGLQMDEDSPAASGRSSPHGRRASETSFEVPTARSSATATRDKTGTLPFIPEQHASGVAGVGILTRGPTGQQNFKSNAAISISAEIAVGIPSRKRPSGPQGLPPPFSAPSKPPTAAIPRYDELPTGSSGLKLSPRLQGDAAAPMRGGQNGVYSRDKIHIASSHGDDSEELLLSAGLYASPIWPVAPPAVPKLALHSIMSAGPPGASSRVSHCPGAGLSQYEQHKAQVLPASMTPIATPSQTPMATPRDAAQEAASSRDLTRVLGKDGLVIDCSVPEQIIVDTIPAVRHCMLVRHWTSSEVGCLFTLKTSAGSMGNALDVAALQLAFDSGSEATTVMSARQCPRFRNGLSLQVQEANRKIPGRMVQVRRFQVLREGLTRDNGQLNDQGEINRMHVLRRYRHIIDDMYQHEHQHQHKWMLDNSKAEEAYNSPRGRPPPVPPPKRGDPAEGDALSRFSNEGDAYGQQLTPRSVGSGHNTPRGLASGSATPRGAVLPPGGGTHGSMTYGVGGQIVTPRAGTGAQSARQVTPRGGTGEKRLPHAGLLPAVARGSTTPRVMGAYSPASTVGAVMPFDGKGAPAAARRSVRGEGVWGGARGGEASGRRRGNDVREGRMRSPRLEQAGNQSLEKSPQGDDLNMARQQQQQQQNLGQILLDGLAGMLDGDGSDKKLSDGSPGRA